MKRIAIVIFFIILLGLIIYLVYVRGFGVSPKLSSPVTIRVGELSPSSDGPARAGGGGVWVNAFCYRRGYPSGIVCIGS